MRQGCSVITPAATEATQATQKRFLGLLLDISSLKSSVKEFDGCLLHPWGIDQFFLFHVLATKNTGTRMLCLLKQLHAGSEKLLIF